MRDLGKLIDAKGFKKLPKVQKIAQPGHTADEYHSIMVPEDSHWWADIFWPLPSRLVSLTVKKYCP